MLKTLSLVRAGARNGALRTFSSAAGEPAVKNVADSTPRKHPLYEDKPFRNIALSTTFPHTEDNATLVGLTRLLSSLDANLEVSRGNAVGSMFWYNACVSVPESLTVDVLKSEIESKLPEVSVMAFDNEMPRSLFEHEVPVLSVEANGANQPGVLSEFVRILGDSAGVIRSLDTWVGSTPFDPSVHASMTALITIRPDTDLGVLERDFVKFQEAYCFEVNAENPEDALNEEGEGEGEGEEETGTESEEQSVSESEDPRAQTESEDTEAGYDPRGTRAKSYREAADGHRKHPAPSRSASAATPSSSKPKTASKSSSRR